MVAGVNSGTEENNSCDWGSKDQYCRLSEHAVWIEEAMNDKLNDSTRGLLHRWGSSPSVASTTVTPVPPTPTPQSLTTRPPTAFPTATPVPPPTPAPQPLPTRPSSLVNDDDWGGFDGDFGFDDDDSGGFDDDSEYYYYYY